MTAEVDYECITTAELEALEKRLAGLTLEVEALQEALYREAEAYESLLAVHNEVVEECTGLKNENAILKQDLDDSAVELEACMAELDICLGALTEAGLLPQTEADLIRKEQN